MQLYDAQHGYDDGYQLVQLAERASDRSYSPYSNFPVGACLITHQGTVYQGTNVENASFGLTICAERAAIFHAIGSEGPDLLIHKIAIHCDASPDVGPCGACRQVIREFSDDQTLIIFGGRSYSMKDLLPLSFGPEDL